MNRNEEYAALLQELEVTPDALETTVQRALKRKKALQKKRRIFGIPAASLAACFGGFVLLVNLFPPFAMACGNIPLLRELVKAVAWSPSLSAAVEHDYVQPMEQTKTENGVTATVEYVIVDRKQVNIFYTLDSDLCENLRGDCGIVLTDGTDDGYSASWSDFGLENGELRRMDVNFMDRDVPDQLTFTVQVYARPEEGPTAPAPEANSGDEMLSHDWTRETRDYLAEFAFDLTFDPAYTARGEIVAVDQAFTLDGQSVTVTEAEVYPTHLRLNLAYDAANTAWLKGLNFYLENERGERFEAAANGITATGSADPEDRNMTSFWLDSPYFSQGEHLTLHITGAEWLDKDKERVKLDLAAGRAEGLPEGVRIEWTKQRTGGWLVSTSTPYRWGSTAMHATWSGTYYDADGNEYSTDGHRASIEPEYFGTLSGQALEEHEAYAAENRDRYFETFALKDYGEDTVWLSPNWTRITTQETAVAVIIK